jgi:hypothetical protein
MWAGAIRALIGVLIVVVLYGYECEPLIGPAKESAPCDWRFKFVSILNESKNVELGIGRPVRARAEERILFFDVERSVIFSEFPLHRFSRRERARNRLSRVIPVQRTHWKTLINPGRRKDALNMGWGIPFIDDSQCTFGKTAVNEAISPFEQQYISDYEFWTMSQDERLSGQFGCSVGFAEGLPQENTLYRQRRELQYSHDDEGQSVAGQRLGVVGDLPIGICLLIALTGQGLIYWGGIRCERLWSGWTGLVVLGAACVLFGTSAACGLRWFWLGT